MTKGGTECRIDSDRLLLSYEDFSQAGPQRADKV